MNECMYVCMHACMIYLCTYNVFIRICEYVHTYVHVYVSFDILKNICGNIYVWCPTAGTACDKILAAHTHAKTNTKCGEIFFWKTQEMAYVCVGACVFVCV